MLASYAQLIVYRGVSLFVVSQVSPTETPVSDVTRELIIGVELAVVQYTIHTNTDAQVRNSRVMVECTVIASRIVRLV